MKKTYTEVRFFKWKEDEISVSLRASSASYGGGSEVLVVDTLVFNDTQVTSPTNGNNPQWGVLPHTVCDRPTSNRYHSTTGGSNDIPRCNWTVDG